MNRQETGIINRYALRALWGAALLLLLLVGCAAPWRAFVRNAPGPHDARIFPAAPVARAGAVTELPYAPEHSWDLADRWAFGRYYVPGDSAQDFFQRTGTLAFLIFQHDSLRYEWYAPGYDASFDFPTFSLVKSYVSLLTGIALQEGYLRSLDQPVAEFLPEFQDTLLDRITIRHLLQMTSGLESHEGYINPWGAGARLYYGKNLRGELQRLNVEYQPGQTFSYKNLNTQVLAWVLEKATGKSLHTYFSEKLWQPLGMEAPATWSLDRIGGDEKAFCCLNAHARDHIRMGKLLLQNGFWNGQRILPEYWMAMSENAWDTTEGSPQFHQFGWYLSAWEQDFYGQGLLGQFLYVCPSQEMIIVRLGKGLKYKVPWYEMFRCMAGLEAPPRTVPVDREHRKSLEGVYAFGTSTRGDSSMYGTETRIRAQGRGLRVENKVNGGFRMLPEAPDKYYQPGGSWRRLEFVRDSSGALSRVVWSRRGNFWDLQPQRRGSQQATSFPTPQR